MKKSRLIILFILVALLVACSVDISSADESDEFDISEWDVSEAVDVEDVETDEPEEETEEDSEGSYEVDWDNIDTSKVDITLPDDYFLNYMDDIYVNLDDYLNKVITGEGYIYYVQNEDGSVEYAFCRDYICCGYDAYPVGVMCVYDGDMVDDDTWVTVTGVIGKEEGQFTDTPLLYITEIKKTKEKSGQRVIDYK